MVNELTIEILSERMSRIEVSLNNAQKNNLIPSDMAIQAQRLLQSIGEMFLQLQENLILMSLHRDNLRKTMGQKCPHGTHLWHLSLAF